MIDPEWRNLMEEWRQAEPEAAPFTAAEARRIRRQARRRGYGLFLLAAGEILSSLGLVVWYFRELPEHHGPVELSGFAALVFFLAVAFAFTYWNRRGVWWPAAESTRTFVEFSAERCRRKLRALRFCPWLLAAELVFLIPWAVWALLSKAAAPLQDWLAVFGWTALSVVAVLWGGAWMRRRTLRELERWEEMARGLAEP
ncbi:MAG TPA: hypothetical protein VF789_14945 [Thermoanaerobaculia bacterium]